MKATEGNTEGKDDEAKALAAAAVATEILIILQEESAEVIQAVSKVIRFGMTAENHESLVKELCDCQAMIDLMYEFKVVECSPVDREANVMRKREKLKKYSSIFEHT